MSDRISRRDFLKQCGRCTLLCAGLEAAILMTATSQSHALDLKKG
ncbi:MAG: twin-arginine translocation signal domain-containing protein, partial [Deltaproteobacteria bacterium]|nr:twin-arginine translocation signal domain-containing protein [Deltaproteobacteria bacterium]